MVDDIFVDSESVILQLFLVWQKKTSKKSYPFHVTETMLNRNVEFLFHFDTNAIIFLSLQ